MDTEEELKSWEEVKKKNRFSHAIRGLHVFWKTTRNLKIHLTVALIAIFLGYYFCITEGEWVSLVFAIVIVLVAEAFNTALEIDINLTSPKFHPFARDTKDVAAGAVFIASLGAVIVGIVIFVPKLLGMIQ